ncbi:hypothetical protein [Streptomyces lateritius]|uniref:hypothetical protein n=1 Tax=Streptomyces lateritius TaxID=67313 RepID=UPI001674EB03|nr:hypothetical protein [Streptomyces lateritius]GGU10822.1 hypothetical protein GCM10010272_64740 [Streptomyces lateritius]
MSALRPGDITDEMIQAMDTVKQQGLQKDLRVLAANIRADAEGRYDSAEPGCAPVSSGRCYGSRTPPPS